MKIEIGRHYLDGDGAEHEIKGPVRYKPPGSTIYTSRIRGVNCYWSSKAYWFGEDGRRVHWADVDSPYFIDGSRGNLVREVEQGAEQ